MRVESNQARVELQWQPLNAELIGASLKPDSHLMSGDSYREREVIAALEAAAAARPEDVEAHNALGIALGCRGRHEEAIAAFSRAVQHSPSDPRLWYNLGVAHNAAGRPSRAARYYLVALRVSPEYRQARLAMEALRTQYPNLPTVEMPAEPMTRPAAPEDQPHKSPAILPEVELPTVRSSQPRMSTILTRLVADLADAVVVQILWVGVVIVLNILQQRIPGLGPLPNGVPLALGALCGLAYVGFTTYHRGQTFGMRIVHLKLVDRVGAPPGFFRCAVRTTMIPLHVATVGIGHLWAQFDRGCQSLHDKIAATYVVGRRLDPGTAIILSAGLLAVNSYLFNFLKLQIFS